MALPQESVSMALFCDFENVALGVRDANYERFDIKPVLERLLLKGSIVVKKAYCDWERYKGFKAAMHEASFELIEIPHVRQSGKNSADIRLVVDALDLCYTKLHVDTFVIISGDSDFSPLVSKLRENAKKVIGVGVKNSTSDLLVANCDEFIFYDDLVREQQRAVAKASAARRAAEDERQPKQEAEARKAKALAIAVETYEALVSERGESGKLWASVLKSAIKRRKPDFNESYYGFRAFGNLLDEAQARGLLEVGRDEKSGAYVYRSGAEPARSDVGAPAPVQDVASGTNRNHEEPARRRDRGGERADARKTPRAERGRGGAATEPQAGGRQGARADASPTMDPAAEGAGGSAATVVTGAPDVESPVRPDVDVGRREPTRQGGPQPSDVATEAAGPSDDTVDTMRGTESARTSAAAPTDDTVDVANVADVADVADVAPAAQRTREKRARGRKGAAAPVASDDLFAGAVPAHTAVAEAASSDADAVPEAGASTAASPAAASDWAVAIASARDGQRKPARRRKRAETASAVEEAPGEPTVTDAAGPMAQPMPDEQPAGAAAAPERPEAKPAAKPRRPARARTRKAAENGG